MTIDFWFRIDRQDYNVLVAKGIFLDRDGNAWYVRQRGDLTGVVDFAIQDKNLNVVSGSTSIPIAAGGFHHLALVRDGTAGRLYVDGTEVATDTNPLLGDISNSHSIFVGADNRLLSDDFAEATIDEIEIFNRALTDSEIEALFNAGTAGKCKDEHGDRDDDRDSESDDLVVEPPISDK